MELNIIRTGAENKDLASLIAELNEYLRGKDGEFHEFYPQHNTLKDILEIFIVYNGDIAIGCGAFKAFDQQTAEIKRMFVSEEYRGKGVSKLILNTLEKSAFKRGYVACVLETGRNMFSAINFYKKNGYSQIPNYGPYINAPHSICFKKEL